MLRRWVAINEADLVPSGELSSTVGRKRHSSEVYETRGELEGRLHAAYGRALKLYQHGLNAEAGRAFKDILQELKKVETYPEESFKRKKTSKGRTVNEKGWETRLRYASNRNLGDICIALGENLEAYERFKTALNDDTTDVMLWARAGRSAAEAGMLHAARAAYEEGLKRVPNHPLCADNLAAVLAAIGDDDLDLSRKKGVVQWSKIKVDEQYAWGMAKKILKARFDLVQKEVGNLKKKSISDEAGVQSHRVGLAELNVQRPLRWPTIVNALLRTLKQRVESQTEMLGASLAIKRPSASRQDSGGPAVVVLSDSSSDSHAKSDFEASVQAGELNVRAPSEKTGEEGNPGAHKSTSDSNEKKNSPSAEDDCDAREMLTPKTATDNEEQGERRRSKRQEEKEQRQREEENQATAKEEEQEKNLLETLLSFIETSVSECGLPKESILFSRYPLNEKEYRNAIELVDFSKSCTGISCTTERDHIYATSPWFTEGDESDQESEIEALLDASLPTNSGPLDLLTKTLHVLTMKKTTRYYKLVASIWLALKAHHLLTVPGSFCQTALVVESLFSITAAERVGEEALREIDRLLSLLPQHPAHVSLGDPDTQTQTLSEIEGLVFCARLAWLRSIAAHRQDDVTGAFDHCSLCLKYLTDILKINDLRIPGIGGPCLAGISVAVAVVSVQRRARVLERSAELRVVQHELEKEKRKSNSDVSRVMNMIMPSMSRTIIELGLFGKEAASIGQKQKLMSQDDLGHSDTALRVREFLRICRLQSDMIGETIGQACQLKLSIMDLERFAAQEKDPEYGLSAAVELAHAELQKIIHQLKPVSNLIKRLAQGVSGKNRYESRNKVGDSSGFSVTEAAVVMGHALCYAASVMEKEVPMVCSTASLVLTSHKKNLRLSLSRAFLGLARCLVIIANESADRKGCEITGHKSEPNSSPHLPHDHSRLIAIIRYMLKRLASRGCLREEGTSGILIKLYSCFLRDQVLFVAGQSLSDASQEERSTNTRSVEPVIDSTDFSYGWGDIAVLRRELAHSYQCLYKIPDLEALERGSAQERWLLDACALNSKLGLGNTPSDPSKVNKAFMDQSTCNSVYVFYRRHFLKAMQNNWKDGKRSRRARDAVRDLLEVLPTSVPSDVPSLTDAKLVDAVSAALEPQLNTTTRAGWAISTLKKAWQESTDKTLRKPFQGQPKSFSDMRKVEVSRKARMHYELNVLNAMCEYTVYESEYKKHLQTERRKSPSEAIERLIKCQSDLVAAVCVKPWSVGAWIALGRIFLEITDVNLDENELVKTFFGSPRSNESESSSWLSFLNRAEGCFQLAYALAKNKWISPWESSSSLLLDAESFDGSFGVPSGYDDHSCDHLFFSKFGVCGEEDQQSPRLLLASSQFGLAGVRLIRIQESMYERSRWARSPFTAENYMKQVNSMFSTSDPSETKNTEEALQYLENGIKLAFEHSKRVRNCFSSQKWFYLLQRAKLRRKLGRGQYLDDFVSAILENSGQSKMTQEKRELEPVYQLHMTRFNLLLSHKFGNPEMNLDDVEACKFRPATSIGSEQPKAHTQMQRIASDIMEAMTSLGPKNVRSFSEYYFKAVYVRVMIKWKLFEDRRAGLKQIEELFRTEQATAIAQSNLDGVHRGYFYLLWNYRFTDTGIEPALESERQFLRWRNKLLKLFVVLLLECSESWTLFGTVSRLKRQLPEDRPIDGASMDDLLGSCAVAALQEFVESCNASAPTLAYAEKCLRRSWEVYTGSLRLEISFKKVLNGKESIGDSPGATVSALQESKRPWCAPKAGLLLFLEYRRWRAAKGERTFKLARENIEQMKARYDTKFPFEKIVKAVESCVSRLKTDSKTMKILKKRLTLRAAKKISESAPKKDVSIDVDADQKDYGMKPTSDAPASAGDIQLDSIDLLDDSLSLGTSGQPNMSQLNLSRMPMVQQEAQKRNPRRDDMLKNAVATPNSKLSEEKKLFKD